MSFDIEERERERNIECLDGILALSSSVSLSSSCRELFNDGGNLLWGLHLVGVMLSSEVGNSGEGESLAVV